MLDSLTGKASGKQLSSSDKDDFKYLGRLRAGSQFRGAGQVYELVEDCDFSSQYNAEGVPNQTKIPNKDANGIIQNYTIVKREVVVNGITKVFKKEITDADSKPFYKIFLPEISDHLTSNPSLAKTEPGIPIGNLDTPPELSNNKSPLVVNTAAVSP